MRLSLLLLCAALVTSFPFVPPAQAEAGWKMAGVRGGLSAISNGTYYHEYEAFTVYQLPWSWRSAGGWGATPRIEGYAGVLHGQHVDGFIGGVGPDFALDKSGFPVELNAGLDFTFLNTPQFGRDSFEGDVQFTSHLGVSYRFSKIMGVGYRFQHMSNAGIYGGSNPGINLHMFAIIFYLDY